MVEKVNTDPYMPQWTLNQKGMQGNYVSDKFTLEEANAIWLNYRDYAIEVAEELGHLGIHKQDLNRVLEPWGWVTQIVTATGTALNNFFALRCHEAAAPAFRKIARMMYLAKRKSTPIKLLPSQWHLPFVPIEEQMYFSWEPIEQKQVSNTSWVDYKIDPNIPDLIKYSAARCAWISYENHQKEGTSEAMLRTYDRLLAEIPVHASPIEHQATPSEYPGSGHGGNFGNGWIQARKLIPHEKITKFEPTEEEIQSCKR